MRILLVSFFYPPAEGIGTIGASRVGNVAAWLARQGHEVRVLTASRDPKPDARDARVSEVLRTRWLEVNAIPKRVLGALRGKSVQTTLNERGAEAARELVGRFKPLADLYSGVINVPDETLGWAVHALPAANRMLAAWKPDLVLASGPPFSAFVIASAIARRAGVPWVADMRDLWTDNPYYRYATWRMPIDRVIERAVLRTAAGLVTVSEPLADMLRKKYRAPIEVVMNGFEPADYPPGEPERDRDTLRILYAGRLYGDRRDPSPLFDAISRLGADKRRVEVDLYVYGGEQAIRELAARFGIAEQVRFHAPVAHADVLRLEREADVLLLLLWNHPSERGVFTGKFFEYIGAERPVLAVGPSFNLAAELITARKLGLASLDAGEIAAWLRALLDAKALGVQPRIDRSSVQEFTRQAQTATLERFLRSCVQAAR